MALTDRKKFGKLWKSYMSSDGNQYVDKNLNVNGRTKSLITAKDLIFEQGPELTIDTGKITITHSFHTVDTESDASSDNLEVMKEIYIHQVIPVFQWMMDMIHQF